MAQSLQIDIKTTSDVPQAMDRAKAATTSFGKQVGDIGKKFGTSFKDIFLSFLGPMALLTAAIGFITKMIADQQQKREDANRAAIEGTNNLMSAEDRYYANKLNKEKLLREQTEEAKTQRLTTTQEFLEQDPRGKKMLEDAMRSGAKYKVGISDAVSLTSNLSQRKDVQDAVRAILAEDMKKNPAAGSTGSALPNSTPFKAPEGFSNVVGVGANPVLTAMDEQLTQLKVMSDLLAAIERAGNGGGVPIDFTKKETPILK
jgi:hypothetical protein